MMLMAAGNDIVRHLCWPLLIVISGCDIALVVRHQLAKAKLLHSQLTGVLLNDKMCTEYGWAAAHYALRCRSETRGINATNY